MAGAEKLKWDSQLGELTTLALNSSDRGVRESGIEVQLAAYGLTKSESSVNYAGTASQSRAITRRKFGRCGLWDCSATAASKLIAW
jgi:hypothetical protein